MTTVPLRAMAGSLRGYWTDAAGYQRLCYVVGTALIAIGLLHGLAFLVLGGAWAGDVSWRKPFTFGVSFGLTTITLAWMAGFLRMGPRSAWPAFGVLAAANTIEVLWVTLQRARGVPSHFNDDTAFDSALFLLNGGVIFVTMTVIVLLTVRAFFFTDAAPSMRLALRGGLLLLNAAMAGGVAMIVYGTVFDAESMTFGAAGIMKVPHAVGIHAIQVLPGLAWLLSFSSSSEDRRLRIVALATAGYAGLVLVSALQTYTGRTPWDVDVLTGALLLASLAALAFAALRTLRVVTFR